jgi:heptosyltransferase II
VKILFVTLSNLGDVVLTLPVLQSLLKARPGAELDVLVGPSGVLALEGDERLRRVTVYDKKMSWASKARLLAGIRRERYDLIVDLRYSLIGLFGGAKRRNAYLTGLSRRGHKSSKHLAALKGLSIAVEGEGFLDGLTGGEIPGLPAGRLVAAAPGSKSDLKKWPAQKYAQLLKRLALEKGCSIVLLGDTNDSADAALVRWHLGNVPALDLTGKTDFRQMVSVLRRASLVITNDSAPLHIADALRVPTLALFGPTDPKKYGPSRQPASIAVSKNLFCQPCERAQCRYGHECLGELEAAEVYSKAARLLDGKAPLDRPRLLVIRLDRIGDLMLSLPAIEALGRHFPGARLSVMTRPETKALLEGHPAIDEVIAYDYRNGGRHAFPLGYFRFLEEIMKRRFDFAVILHPGIRSYLVPFLAGIPMRVGYRGRHDWLLTRKVADQRHLGRKHESEYAMEVVEALTERRSFSSPSKWVPDSTAMPEVPEGRWLAVHPGASCPSKRWPAERFRTLVGELLMEFPKHRVAVIGGPESAPDAARVVSGAGERVTDLSGKLDLRQLTALLSKCDLLISNDSGPVHVAAAVGTKVISLFGRNSAGLSPQRWRPLGKGHTVLQKEVGCMVCLAHECPIGFECLKAITVDDVMEAARKTLLEPALIK